MSARPAPAPGRSAHARRRATVGEAPVATHRNPSGATVTGFALTHPATRTPRGRMLHLLRARPSL